MTLFVTSSRHDTTLRHPHESWFNYLNRSAHPRDERVRQLIGTWLSDYPEAHRGLLAGRLCGDDRHHFAAFFELFVFVLMRKCGHVVTAVEPALRDTEKRPDFLVRTKDGAHIYVECVTTFAQPEADDARERRMREIQAAIAAIPYVGYEFALEPDGLPGHGFPIKSFKQEVERWLQCLRTAPSAMSRRRFDYREYGLTIRTTAHRLPHGSNRETTPATVVRVQWGWNTKQLNKALKDKFGRYGNFDHPYLVAVNVINPFIDPQTIIDTLLGRGDFRPEPTDDGTTLLDWVRHGAGLWTGRADGEDRSPAAVFATTQLTPWTVAACHGRLIHNSHADPPLPPFPLGAETWSKRDGNWHVTAGTPFGAVLGLSAG